MKRIRSDGWWLPMLKTRNGAALVAGVGCIASNAGSAVAGFPLTRTTASTMSST
jgi:hypothetical protein